MEEEPSDHLYAIISEQYEFPDDVNRPYDFIYKLMTPSTLHRPGLHGCNVSVALQPPPIVFSEESILQYAGERGLPIILDLRQNGENTTFAQLIENGIVRETKIRDALIRIAVMTTGMRIRSYEEDTTFATLRSSILQILSGSTNMVPYFRAARDHYRVITEESIQGNEEQRTTSPIIPHDHHWWADDVLKSLALLRQLSYGFDILEIVEAPDEIHDNPSHWKLPWTFATKRVGTIDNCFLDILLNSDVLKHIVIEKLLKRLVEIQELLPRARADFARNHCINLQERIVRVLRRNGGTYQLPNEGRLVLSELVRSRLPWLHVLLGNDLQFGVSVLGRRRSIPPHLRQEMESIRRERGILIREYIDRRFRWGLLPVAYPSPPTVIHREENMPFVEFRRRTELMMTVNETLPKSFVPGVSKPSFRMLDLPYRTWLELQHVFFGENGKLRDSIKSDVAISDHTVFINFHNAACLLPRNDQRWQLQFRHHSAGEMVATRATVERILSAAGVFDRRNETIRDLGILIGGTEDQSLHHDIPRQTAGWRAVDRPNVEPPIAGWEINRLGYHDVMTGPYPPRSVLFGLGTSDMVRIGIQKNQIIREGNHNNHCLIIGGENQVFPIHRTNEFLVEISCHGCTFLGDFVHAGVNNVKMNSDESNIMGPLLDHLQQLQRRFWNNYELVCESFIDTLFATQDLNLLCRFHCSIEPIVSSITIPRNEVNFFGCWPNGPH